MFSAIFWKKAWVWLKNYWYWPLLAVMLAFAIISGNRVREKMLEMMVKQSENYQKEISILKDMQAKKDAEAANTIEEFHEEIEKIEKEHDIKVEALDVDKKKELVKIIKEKSNSPDELAKDIANLLDAQYMEK